LNQLAGNDFDVPKTLLLFAYLYVTKIFDQNRRLRVKLSAFKLFKSNKGLQ
jgi:hypothetical protein